MNLTKTILLHLKFLKNIVHLWQFSDKIKKLVPRIPFSLSDTVFALRRPPENPKKYILKQSRIGLFWGEI